MTDRREAVLAAFKGALDGVAGVQTCVRNEVYEFKLPELPALNQVDGGHSKGRDESETDNYDMAVDVEIYATAPSAAGLGPALNALWSGVVKAVEADVTLRETLHAVARQTGMNEPEFGRDDGVGLYAAAVATFSVEFGTAEGDPEAAP